MTAGSAREGAGGGQHRGRSAAEVLADRLAAEVVRHEPGWRLPRRSALARRYNVNAAQIDVALTELAGRHLLRRLPDGRLQRASPAEYLVPLPGAPGLRSRVGPRAAGLTCRSRQAGWRQVPEDIGWALGAGPGERVYVVQAVWAAGDEPAAHATAYLPAGPGVPPPRPGAGASAAAAGQSLLSLTSGPELPGNRWSEQAVPDRPAALQLEMQPPPPSIARRLHLPAGQPAALVTARFDDPATGRPSALTVTVLRPDLLRIAVQLARP